MRVRRETPCVYSANPAAVHSRRLTYHELQPSASFVSGYATCARACALWTIDTTAKNRNANYSGYFQVPARPQWSVNSTVPHLTFTCPGTSGPTWVWALLNNTIWSRIGMAKQRMPDLDLSCNWIRLAWTRELCRRSAQLPVTLIKVTRKS